MYLFLAVPNFCGSTLIHNLIGTCPNVATLSIPGSEGQRADFVEGNMVAGDGYHNLYGPYSLEATMEHVYADPNNYNWPYIKETWDKNWAESNPYAKIKLQKTPADIFRIKTVNEYFPDTKWILSVRNPYAYIESTIRNFSYQIHPVWQLDQICYHVLRVLELQIENQKLLGDNAYVVTYEDFCADLAYHRNKLIEWLPELEGLDFDKHTMVKEKLSPIINNNEENIQGLINRSPELLNEINKYFIPMKHVLDHWGYEIREK